MESQPHILFISSWYPNRNDSTHGIFNQHFVQAAALYHKTSVLHICSEESLNRNMEMLSQSVHGVFTQYVYTQKIKTRIPFLAQWLKRRRLLCAYDKGFELLVKERGLPQIIHLNVVLPAGIGVLHLHKKYGIPFVVNEGWTGYMKEDGIYKGTLIKYLTEKVLAAASFILPVSKDLQEAMLCHGLKGRYKVVPNVIQTEIFKPSSTLTSTSFIHISTFDPRQKNVMGILRAFKKALEKKPDLNLFLVGEGEHKSELLEFVKTNGLEKNVQFKGKADPQTLSILLNQCKALIMFSNYESFGVVIGEALACGVPVICSKSGGLSNLITAELGIAVEKQNEEQLCEAILRMTENSNVYDKAVLRNFVNEQFSETVIANALKAVYQETTNRKQKTC